MPQIERNIAAVFLVFAGIYVNQFSLPFAIAVLVAAILVHRGYQMSDLKVNVHNSNRVQTLASSLYSWTEHAVSAIAEKCKLLTNTENRASPRNASSHLESDIRQDYYPDTENVFNRDNLYRGNNLVRKVNYQSPEKASPYSSTTPGGQTKSPNKTFIDFTNNFMGPHQQKFEKEILSPRDSPWGYSLSPQQRGPVADVKPVQAIAGPLLASAKYNAKRNSNLYVNVSSPGFSSRLLKYSEAATHQPQYARPGQLPLVHLNKSPMPTLSPHNSRKVQVPVRLRIAPPSYDASESRLFSRNDQQELEQQSKSVVDVLKEISRKRFRTEDIVSDPKRHHRSDSSSSSSSSSSPAFGNGMSCDQIPSGKRPREEDSPKLQKKSIKRTHNNEIFSSLSSSRNIRVGTKRKAVENLSRSTTPSPIGKLLKKSPHSTPIGTSEVVLKSSEHSSQQQGSVSKPKESLRKEEKVSDCRPLISQIHSQEAVRDSKPSTSQLEEHQKGEDKVSKVQPSKSQYGRLFAKTLSKGTPVLQESAKEKKKSGGKIPWISQTTADIDAITEEDILSEDFTHGNRRLNRMLSVISSAGNASSDSSKGDMVDGNSAIKGSSKPSDNGQETRLSASTSETDKQGMGDIAKIIPEKNHTPAAPSIIEIKEPRPISTTSEVTLPKPAQVTVASTVVPTSTLSPALSAFKASSSTPSSLTMTNTKQASGDSSVVTPVTLVQSVSNPILTSPVTSSAFSLPQTTPVSVPTTSQATLSNPLSSSVQTQPSASLTESSRNFVTVTSAPSIFGTQKLEEKQPVSSSPSFLFGASSASNVQAASNSKPVFTLPTSNVAAIPTASTALQSTASSPFSVTSTSTASSSSPAITVKPASSAVTSGGFTFGAAPVVTSSSIEFPKTMSSIISFGGISTPKASVTSSQAVAPSLINAKNTTSAVTDTTSKPTFSFGALPTSSASVPVTTAPGGFHFQFGTSTQSSVTVPKPQEAGTGFKFTFDANKESTPLSQPSAASLSKPPTFGGGFSFGATSTNSQESKTMTFGSTGSINPTPAPASAGFSFSASNDPGSNIQKPAFGLGATGQSAAPSNPLTSGGFNFGVKPSESTTMTPSAPNVAAPFQFGASSTAPGLPVQQQQAPVMGNPFSVGGTTEQKPMEERFTFGSVQSTSMSTTLQANPPAFEQQALPSFSSPNVNPLQNPVPANSSLFRFSSSGAIGQPGMFSGGCSFGQTTATGVASTGFNFNPTGPSATTPFQFGATPAAPMFSIGSGSTAPRSRPRNRRQK